MSELVPSSRLVRAGHVQSREFDGELVLLDLRSGQYFSLRDVGSLAWRRMCEGRTFQEVAEEVADHYDVGVTSALNDLLVLGTEWLRHGLVETP